MMETTSESSNTCSSLQNVLKDIGLSEDSTGNGEFLAGTQPLDALVSSAVSFPRGFTTSTPPFIIVPPPNPSQSSVNNSVPPPELLNFALSQYPGIPSSSHTEPIPSIELDDFEVFQNQRLRNELLNFLKTSWEGLIILYVYHRDGHLSNNCQNLLTELLISRELNRVLLQLFLEPGKPIRKIQIPTQTFLFLAKSIELAFKDKATIYYTPYVKTAEGVVDASGKLWDRFNYVKKILRDAGVLEKSNRGNPSGQIVQAHPATSEQVKEQLDWLLLNISPWPTLVEYWKGTFDARQVELIQEASLDQPDPYFKYPGVRESTGKDLVSIDFYRKFPGREQSLSIAWEKLKVFIPIYANELKITTKDSVAAGILSDLPNIAPENQDAALLMLLCCLVKPSKLKNTRGIKKSQPKKRKVANKENDTAPLTNQGNQTVLQEEETSFRDDFIVFVKIAADIDEEIKKRQVIAKAKHKTVQPYLLCVGSHKRVSTVYVIVDDIKYQVESPLKGLDLTFKIFWAANLEYPQDFVIVWMFFQRAVYQIKKSTDKLGTQLNKLFSSLQRNVGISVD